MTVAIKPIETGAPLGAGPFIPPVIGDVGLWSHVWGAATLNGAVADGASAASVPAAIGTRALTVAAAGKARLADDPSITFDVADGTSAQLSTGAGFSTASAWTMLLVCDVTTGGSQTVHMPGMVAALAASSWTFYGAGSVPATLAGTGKAVYVVTRNGSAVTVWRNGVKSWTGTVSPGSQSSLGMSPTGGAKFSWFHLRFTEVVLTDAQITAASNDALALHRI